MGDPAICFIFNIVMPSFLLTKMSVRDCVDIHEHGIQFIRLLKLSYMYLYHTYVAAIDVIYSNITIATPTL